MGVLACHRWRGSADYLTRVYSNVQKRKKAPGGAFVSRGKTQRRDSAAQLRTWPQSIDEVRARVATRTCRRCSDCRAAIWFTERDARRNRA